MTQITKIVADGKPPEMPFACVLRAFRSELGWTQRETAKWLGISPRTLEYWESEKGVRKPSRICQAGAFYLLEHARKHTNGS